MGGAHSPSPPSVKNVDPGSPAGTVPQASFAGPEREAWNNLSIWINDAENNNQQCQPRKNHSDVELGLIPLHPIYLRPRLYLVHQLLWLSKFWMLSV
jgi:hypothetical protein